MTKFYNLSKPMGNDKYKLPDKIMSLYTSAWTWTVLQCLHEVRLTATSFYLKTLYKANVSNISDSPLKSVVISFTVGASHESELGTNLRIPQSFNQWLIDIGIYMMT